MKKLSKVVLIMVIIMGVVIASSQVQASIVLNPSNTTAGTGNTTTGTGTTTTDKGNTTTGTGNTTAGTGNTTTSKGNTTTGIGNKTTNTLPKTGIEDSPAGIIMIIGVISAVYAYKKIRDYNV